MWHSLLLVVDFALGFGVAFMACTLADSWLYGALSWSASRGATQGRLVSPPIINFLYNLDPANLAQHGLHPRWLHAVVNAPLLFSGPAVLSYLALARLVCRWKQTRPNACYMTVAATFVFGLAFLSSAPHQEPRFLLPLLVPVVLLSEAWLHGQSPLLVRRVLVRLSVRHSRAGCSPEHLSAEPPC